MSSPQAEAQGPANDLELLAAAAAGEEEAFERLVERHGQRLYALAVSLVSSIPDAQDVLQETFLGAFRGLAGFKGQASVRTWLTRILVTQAAKCLRDRQRRRRHESTGIGGEVAAAGTDVQKVLDVQAALGWLTMEQREVLVLREFEQLSYQKMAEVLGVPQGTVESRLYRAREAMKEILGDYRV